MDLKGAFASELSSLHHPCSGLARSFCCRQFTHYEDRIVKGNEAKLMKNKKKYIHVFVGE